MRLLEDSADNILVEFQSTHPVWDATGQWEEQPDGDMFQSTHPVWDATRVTPCSWIAGEKFQSTHPVWDATAFFKHFTTNK